MNTSTKELSEELENREGVVSFNVEPYEVVTITAGDKAKTFTGPAVIIINQD